MLYLSVRLLHGIPTFYGAALRDSLWARNGQMWIIPGSSNYAPQLSLCPNPSRLLIRSLSKDGSLLLGLLYFVSSFPFLCFLSFLPPSSSQKKKCLLKSLSWEWHTVKLFPVSVLANSLHSNWHGPHSSGLPLGPIAVIRRHCKLADKLFWR